MNKKGFELSINFIVILIMSIIVFASGLALTNTFFSSAKDKQTELDQETMNEIEKLLNDGSRVAIPVHKKDINIGHEDIFGLGIYNVLGSETEFEITITFSGAYDEQDVQISAAQGTYIDDNSKWHFYGTTRNVTIKHNEYLSVPLLFHVRSNIGNNQPTVPGTYIFNVNVSYPDGGTTKLYDNSIHKIWITVKK